MSRSSSPTAAPSLDLTDANGSATAATSLVESVATLTLSGAPTEYLAADKSATLSAHAETDFAKLESKLVTTEVMFSANANGATFTYHSPAPAAPTSDIVETLGDTSSEATDGTGE